MADTGALKQWADSKKADDDAEGEEPEATEQPTGDEDEGMEPNSEFVKLVTDSRMAIEEAAQQMDEEELTNLDEELSPESSDKIAAELDELPQELQDMLAEIEESDIVAATNAVEDDLEAVTPQVFAAWLYRAHQAA